MHRDRDDVRPSVRSVFVVPFTESFEGGISNCYADLRGKCTVAYGNLVDTPGEVAALPLVRVDGSPASVAEKVALWNVIHDDPHAADAGWRYAARLSPLRLTREGMTALATGRLESNDRILRAMLVEWETLPACAQLAMHSWAWACGPHAGFPRLFEAVRAGDYAAAAVEIHMNERTPEGKKNSGLVGRNVANKILMRNAGRVRDFHLDPDLLDWTHDLSVSDAPTVPALPDSTPIEHVSPDMYRLDDEPPDDVA